MQWALMHHYSPCGLQTTGGPRGIKTGTMRRLQFLCCVAVVFFLEAQ